MYKITLRKRAVKEYLHAIIWYWERSLQAAEILFDEAFSKLEFKPGYYRNSYEHFHEIKTRKYPYAIGIFY